MESTNTPQLVQNGPEWFEAGLAYRYQMPDGPGPYPTAIMLHGRMGDEDVMWIFRKSVPRPWFVVAPRAPVADRDGYSWLIQPPDAWPDLSHMRPAADALARFLRALPRLYNADPDRMYLMGFSQGAAVSIATALIYPALIRGVAALVGFAPDVPAGELEGKLDGLPVFFATGTRDQTVPYAVAQRSVDLVRAAGADVTYREYPIGHKLSADGMSDLRGWFSERV